MKRLVLCASLLLGVTLLSVNTASAIDLKASALSAVKGNTSAATTTATTTTSKSAANEEYQKSYQETIAAQTKKLEEVKTYDKQAKLELAKVILSSDELAEINKLTGDEQETKLNEQLIAALSAETFKLDYAEYTTEQKDAYYNAVQKIQIADNRYKNVSNELTAPLKQIVDGNVSAISAKDELKNAGALILGIKKNLGVNNSLKRAINKVNKANNVVVTVPDSERVVYPSTGVIGSINSQLDEIDTSVNKANATIAKVYYSAEQQKSLQAIMNNKDLSEEEKQAELKAKAKEYYDANTADGTISKAISSLSDSEKKEYQEACSTVISAVGSYSGLALTCTKLGFNISKNPLVAAPLVFEVGALKDTASLLKSSASNLTKSVTQIKKINSANGITVE